MLSTPNSVSTSVEPAAQEQPLSPKDLYRLTLWKWRYSFESMGFNDYQVDNLLLLTWMYATGRIKP
jgi:hypothetical protein